MEFEFKLYDGSGNFKQQINSKKVYSKIFFQEELNGGQGNLTLTVEGVLNDFLTSDIIEIRNSLNGDLYTGILEEIGVTEFEDSSILDLKFLGVFTVLNDIEYKSGGSRTFTKTDTVGNIVKDIIDSFNAEYGTLADTQVLQTNIIRYTGTSIDITGSSVGIDFNSDSCIEAIRKTIENTGFNFYIGKDGIVYLKQKANQDKKYITFEKEILSITRTISKKEMVNKYYLSGQGVAEATYSDPTYINLFKLKEKTVTDSSILDITTRDTKGNEFIAEKKLEDNIVTIRIAPNSIDLVPGDLITTLNSRNNLVEKQITKIDIQKEYSTIYLGNFISFGKTIVKG